MNEGPLSLGRMTLVICMGLLSSCSSEDTGEAPAEVAPVATVDATAAKSALATEPKIKEVLYQPGQTVEWTIGVLDDGTSRIGYANYVCEVLKEHGIADTVVRIADVVKASSNGDFRAADLGTIHCDSRAKF